MKKICEACAFHSVREKREVLHGTSDGFIPPKTITFAIHQCHYKAPGANGFPEVNPNDFCRHFVVQGER